jgi:hypothetical protein
VFVGKTLLARIEGADDRLLSQVYDTASRLLLARRHDLEARLALDRLMLRLGLSQDEAARMLGVSGETVRRWQRGPASLDGGSARSPAGAIPARAASSGDSQAGGVV